MTRRGRLLGLAVTAVCLVLALLNVDPAAVGRELATADYRWLPLAALCTLTGYAVRARRWQLLLRPIRSLPYRTVAGVMMLGFAANNVLPARVGELVRAFGLGRRVGLAASVTLTTVIVERTFDGLTLLFLMAVALRLAPVIVESDRLRLVELASLAIFLGATAFLVAALLFRPRVSRLIAWCTGLLPRRIGGRVLALADSFLAGLDCVRRPSGIAQAALLSLLVWLCEGASYAAVAAAFRLELAPLDQAAAVLFVVVFVNLGIMIPSGPGYVGTFHYFALLALTPFGVASQTALGLAVASHAVQYVLVTAIGLAILWRQRLSLAMLMRAPAPREASAD